MRFTKIRYSAKKVEVHLEWTETNTAGDSIDHVLKSTDAPRPELLEALAALRPFASEMCECGEWGDTLRPIGLTLTYGEKANGCVITCLRAVSISTAPLVLNTPHLTTEMWPFGLPAAIEELESEAELYLHGNRLQARLELMPPAIGAAVEEEEG